MRLILSLFVLLGFSGYLCFVSFRACAKKIYAAYPAHKKSIGASTVLLVGALGVCAAASPDFLKSVLLLIVQIGLLAGILIISDRISRRAHSPYFRLLILLGAMIVLLSVLLGSFSFAFSESIGEMLRLAEIRD